MIKYNRLIFAAISLIYFSTQASDDSKVPYNAFDEKVTDAIKAANKERRSKLRAERKAAKEKTDASTILIRPGGSINDSTPIAAPPVYKKRCCPEWCGDFCLPLTVLCAVLLMGGGAAYCKQTSSCLGFENDPASNSTLATNAPTSHPINVPQNSIAWTHNTPSNTPLIPKQRKIKNLMRERRPQTFYFKRKK